MAGVTVTLMGKPGCHLCEEARDVIGQVLLEHPDVSLEEVSLEDNPLWADQYGELIPVVFINGVEYSHWRVDREKFAGAVRSATSRG